MFAVISLAFYSKALLIDINSFSNDILEDYDLNNSYTFILNCLCNTPILLFKSSITLLSIALLSYSISFILFFYYSILAICSSFNLNILLYSSIFYINFCFSMEDYLSCSFFILI